MMKYITSPRITNDRITLKTLSAAVAGGAAGSAAAFPACKKNM
jgi:hypothetical protein